MNEPFYFVGVSIKGAITIYPMSEIDTKLDADAIDIEEIAILGRFTTLIEAKARAWDAMITIKAVDALCKLKDE